MKKVLSLMINAFIALAMIISMQTAVFAYINAYREITKVDIGNVFTLFDANNPFAFHGEIHLKQSSV